MLQNDQLALTEELNRLLQQYFSQNSKPSTSSEVPSSTSRGTTAASSLSSSEPVLGQSLQPHDQKRPFALGTINPQVLTREHCSPLMLMLLLSRLTVTQLIHDGAVGSVAEGSPASQAGLRPGDRIIIFGEAGGSIDSIAKYIPVRIHSTDIADNLSSCSTTLFSS